MICRLVSSSKYNTNSTQIVVECPVPQYLTNAVRSPSPIPSRTALVDEVVERRFLRDGTRDNNEQMAWSRGRRIFVLLYTLSCPSSRSIRDTLRFHWKAAAAKYPKVSMALATPDQFPAAERADREWSHVGRGDTARARANAEPARTACRGRGVQLGKERWSRLPSQPTDQS